MELLQRLVLIIPIAPRRCSLGSGTRRGAGREEYGAQPPIEILRQWFDQDGWFDRKELSFRKIIDVTMVCSMGLPGGGR